MDDTRPLTVDKDVWDAARGYTKPTLTLYDVGVYRIFNPLAWRCHTRHLTEHYRRNVRAVHLEAGCGTGYLADECFHPSTDGDAPSLTLLDLSPGSLEWSARRLSRFSPKTIHQSLFEKLPPPERPHMSVCLNYVLHCLPGTLEEKGKVIANLKAVMAPEGVLFGSTILGKGVHHNLLARITLWFFYKIGSFHNQEDHAAGFEAILRAQFRNVQCQTIGAVLLFSASDGPLP